MKKLLLSCFVVAGFAASAQVTGIKTIGTDYPTLADAFTALNTDGVGAGGATINIPAGYTETAPSGGFLLGNATLNATLSAGSPLIIQRTGSGLNPVFTANTGVGTFDGFFNFVGVDYVTIDGIDLQENAANATAVELMERGFAFYNLSATDGANYNTVKNCNITQGLKATHASYGISFAHSDVAGVAINPSSLDGTHSYNKVENNTIRNAMSIAIAFLGYNNVTYYDVDNTITGNTIEEQGPFAEDSSGYITTYGIVAQYQKGTNVSSNDITFAAAGFGAVGVLLLGNTATTFTANDNTVSAPTRNTYYASASSVSAHNGIQVSGTGATAIMNGNDINMGVNTFQGSSVPAVYGLTSANTGGLTAEGNTVAGSSFGTFYGIYSASTGTTVTVNINNNNIGNITGTGAVTTSTPYGIYMAATAKTTNLFRNKIYNLQTNGTAGVVHGIYFGAVTASTDINVVNNLIGDFKAPSANSATASSGIWFNAASATSNLRVYYNSIHLNMTSTGTNFNTTGIYHTNNATATSSALDLRNNVIVNLSTPNGTGRASALRRNATGIVNYATTSNNNNFVVGTGSNQVIYYNQTTNYADLAAFKAHVASRETNSLSSSAIFSSIDGSSADFLKPNPSANENWDNKGAVITDYTTDYAGATRDATTPDMGAYEFTYVAPVTVPDCSAITAPANAATGIIPNPTSISWAISAKAEDYKIYIGTTSGGTDIVNGTVTTDTSYNITLNPNTTYYVKIVPHNNIGDATGCTEISFTTGDLVYCAATATTLNNDYERITRVRFSDIDNPSTASAVSGYEDFTHIVGNVERKGIYPIIINIVNFDADQTAVWIDYNQDGIFSNDERTYMNVNAAESTGSVTIPESAKLGQTRMRVRTNYNADPPACGNTSFGQVEDYTINISDVTQATANIAKGVVSVYPNPFADVLKISDVKDVKSVSVSDASGRQVKTLKPSAELNLSSLTSGVYVVTLHMNDGSVKTFKTIKK